MDPERLIAIIGAGPVGLAAAARLIERGLHPVIFEQGPGPAAAVRDWGHVRVFTPWRYLVDEAAGRMLRRNGWTPPDPDELPTGAEIADQYLEPLARLPAIARGLHTRALVTAVTRKGIGKLQTSGREQAPFLIHWQDREWQDRHTLVRAVIDASGTWYQPAPLGVMGIPVPGEEDAGERLAYGIPDVLGAERARYAGRRVLVVGGGHSAMNAVLDLLRLREAVPGTEVVWALRRAGLEHVVGGGRHDELPARGELGLAAAQAVERGDLQRLAPFSVTALSRTEHGLRVDGVHAGRHESLEVDRVVACTGFRPNTAMLRELRLELDPVMEAPPRLAPLIDPNVHSCGTVPPHGVDELRHPESGFYIAGMKSYGRAPTFLMATGYEQVRSIAAELAGDHEAAREVHLQLPDTGVCSAGPAGSCCAPAPAPRRTPSGAASCCGGG
ncbi:FAD-dependent oxidoreductase [Spiribacter halobius]|uniref:Flavoprotein n=1 Tax=Sediminicurvatus halobius TaxID=2182432 RepID=A0A2U2MXT5_9GAMM|nr:FAD-dependent oxidoreductase [Spiribacter halobius]PWG61845.1 flavoprotein [Spiribacter halobius]UEX77688.1 NAD(P)/FAD-dependent oxidoreductase [Spiribacter halobius]